MERVGLVERWTGERLENAHIEQTFVTSPLLPGFSLDLARLFRE